MLAADTARGGEFRVFAVGDIGLPGPTRDFVVAEMTARMADRRADAVLLLGDNFYPDGVASVEDEQWRSKFEQLFPAEIFPIPFYACLGNHDHSGNAAAQVEYTKRSTRWRMPAPFYSFSRDLGLDRSAQFFVLDTQRVWKDHSADTPQLAWLENELAHSVACWKVVIGHHFIRSGGAHGEHGILREVALRLEPLLERHGVDLYVSGHDHDLQLLRTDAGWLQVVSGAGSELRDSGRTRDSLFAESKPGFASFVLRPAELRVEFYVATEGLVHAHVIRKPRAEGARVAVAELRQE